MCDYINKYANTIMTGNELTIMYMQRYSNYCGDSLKLICAARELKGVLQKRVEPSLAPALGKLAGIINMNMRMQKLFQFAKKRFNQTEKSLNSTTYTAVC